jgi:hypothetical protein
LKLVLALFALMLAIGFTTLWVWRRAPVSEPCASRDIAQSRSPDQRTQADVFEVRCGQTAATHVALRPAGAPEHARGDIFVAPGTVPVRLIWNGSSELAVESPADRVFVEETRWRGIAVRVRRSR